MYLTDALLHSLCLCTDWDMLQLLMLEVNGLVPNDNGSMNFPVTHITVHDENGNETQGKYILEHISKVRVTCCIFCYQSKNSVYTYATEQ